MFKIPARGLFGYRGDFLTDTRGEGTMHHRFLEWGPWAGQIRRRDRGVLVSMADTTAVAYALFNLQDRGRLFVDPNVEVYEGQIVGLHSRGNDLPVNPTKAKQLTNIRAAGTDEALTLTPPVKHTLEQALEFIEDDELVEVTPRSIRLRKKLLQEHERKRASRDKA